VREAHRLAESKDPYPATVAMGVSGVQDDKHVKMTIPMTSEN
jgi:hypothetical protein